MLGTMPRFDYNDDFDEFRLEGRGSHLSEEEASLVTLHQLTLEALVKRCDREMNANHKGFQQALAEGDIIGKLSTSYRTNYLLGYQEGLRFAQHILHDLAEGADVGEGIAAFNEETREQIRQRAVRDFVRINEEILRRQEKKAEQKSTDN